MGVCVEPNHWFNFFLIMVSNNVIRPPTCSFEKPGIDGTVAILIGRLA